MKYVCDICGKDRDSASEEEDGFSPCWPTSDDSPNILYECCGCFQERADTKGLGHGLTVSCTVCGAESGDWRNNGFHPLVRLSPGVFVCASGNCKERYPQVKRMSDKLMGEYHKDKLVSELQKAKDSRTVRWKPRPINW